MPDLLRDLNFGARILIKSPVFTVTAVLLLAVGIGANMLIFSVINALLLRPLPVANPETLVRVVDVHPNDFLTWDLPYDFCATAALNDRDFSESICQGEADVAFRDADSTERVRVHLVSPNFFSSLGVRARLGRVLSDDDERTQARNAVLACGFWQRRFHGDASIVGRTVNLGGYLFTIVGVSPEDFNGLTVDTSPDIRVPAALDRLIVQRFAGTSVNARPLFGQAFARLRPGVTLERANADLDRLLVGPYNAELDKINPGSGAPSVIATHLRLESVANGVSNLRGQFSSGLEVLMTGVALLLLMACANLAGLLLARSTARTGEFAIRLALGASRGRLVRQLLIEGTLLAVLGGAAGIALTTFCLPLLVHALPPVRDRAAVLQPQAVHVALDWRVLGFALLVTFATAILFALSPALRSARADVVTALTAARTATRRAWSRHLIVSAQVALCTLILIGAALLIATLERMRTMSPGFDRDRVVTFTIDPGVRAYQADQARALSKALLERTRALPGVDDAGLAWRAVMRGTGMKATLAPAGSRVTANDFMSSSLNQVTPEYFATMGMTLLAGRSFNAFDREPTNPKRVIVNQAFARRFFPGRNPIGQRFGYVGKDGLAQASNEIIGVVSDAKYRSLREPIPPTVFNSALDGFDSGFVLHVRTRQRPEAMIAPVRDALRTLDPEMPIIEASTLRDEVETSLWQERLLAWLASLFGAVSVLLASIGLYGALDYAVKSRTREIGIRVAVGAHPLTVAGMLSREALLIVASGIVVGFGAYAAAAIWIERVLYDVRPWEPFAVIAVSTLVLFIGVAATALPVLRAIRINPAIALRAE